jgi:hypothetical protein
MKQRRVIPTFSESFEKKKKHIFHSTKIKSRNANLQKRKKHLLQSDVSQHVSFSSIPRKRKT